MVSVVVSAVAGQDIHTGYLLLLDRSPNSPFHDWKVHLLFIFSRFSIVQTSHIIYVLTHTYILTNMSEYLIV